MGDLSCREIKSVKAIIGLFSHHGDCQAGRKRGAQAAIGQAPCLSKAGVRSYSASANGAKMRDRAIERYLSARQRTRPSRAVTAALSWSETKSG